jgi:hypothetical protein
VSATARIRRRLGPRPIDTSAVAAALEDRCRLLWGSLLEARLRCGADSFCAQEVQSELRALLDIRRRGRAA